MNESLIGAFVGAFIASIPTILSVISNVREMKENRKHEIRMKKIDVIDAAKVTCIQEFSRELGKCLALADSKDVAEIFNAHAAYLDKFEKLALYVSEDTFKAMQAVTSPCYMSVIEESVIHLNRCLRSEMQSVLLAD